MRPKKSDTRLAAPLPPASTLIFGHTLALDELVLGVVDLTQIVYEQFLGVV
jgi:hypothetical protein